MCSLLLTLWTVVLTVESRDYAPPSRISPPSTFNRLHARDALRLMREHVVERERRLEDTAVERPL